jgi:PAS domain S-box-containing protein
VRIPVIYHDNTEDSVPDASLQELLSSNRIKLFYRFSEGWVKVGTGALRGGGGYYDGPERRSATDYAKSAPEPDELWPGGELRQYRERLVKQRSSDLQAEIISRRQTEDALRQGELRFRELVETMQDWIWETDADLRFTYVNSAVERLLGIGQNDCIGKTLFDLIPPEEADRVHSNLRQAAAKKTPLPLLEHSARHKNGSLLTLECSAVPFFYPQGSFGGFRGMSRDISGRRKLEEELLTTKKLESVGVLAGGIAHDFNNFFQVVMGNIALAKDLERSNRQVADLLEAAEAASLRASNLTKRLITFAEGGMPIKERIYLRNLIRDVTLLAMAGSHANWAFEIAGDLWPVEADEGQIGQVISNIVLNARKAMDDKGTLFIRAENIEAGAEQCPFLTAESFVRISIQDNGVGIPGESLSRLFDPYFTTEEMGAEKGKGLGLAVCHSIIKRHNGHIHVESKVGEGSTFTIYLPASIENEGVQSDASRELAGGRVLVMDNSESLKRICGPFLARIGYDMEFAKDGEEAMRLYREASECGMPFDAVILDVTGGGEKAARKIMKEMRKTDPGVKAIVSGSCQDDPIVSEFRKYGFKGALAKPYTGRKLAEAICAVRQKE